ncbi:MAG: TylF/MycF family methyltransferase [Bacteroidales bacterium]|nr:TylF/MycF family methyltransferase [Bacteroidales bacterium]
MLIEIISIAALAVLLVMLFIAWRDRQSGSGNLPEAYVQQKKNKAISKAVLKLQKTYPDSDRFFLFWLQIQRLDTNLPEGAMAELGVYQGETALLLHALSPNRLLHLFDTFEGFRQEDLNQEKGEAATYKPHHFADTSVESVKEKLNKHPNIKFYKGDFATQCHLAEKEKFALVSIDVDLAKPTAEGLRFFYPRLLPGGVIFIHDYNPKWPELMRVVDDFLKEIPENAVLASDKDSSLIIVKNG